MNCKLPGLFPPKLAAILSALLAAVPLPGAPTKDSSVVLQWNFDGNQEHGKSPSEVAGLHLPDYPDFATNNRSGFFDGKSGFIVVKDHERGGSANLRFDAGDSITLEAWVRVKSIGAGEMRYLIGKGRNVKTDKDLGDQNQNFAMRLHGTPAGSQLGFLFTSIDHKAAGKRHWHRWHSKTTLSSAAWHHVAIVHTFGKKGRLRGYIDGKEVKGIWDLDGDTDLPPVTDAADLVVGSGYTRGPAQSFSGWMDNLVLHRSALSAEELSSRFHYNAPPPPPPPVTTEMLPAGKILVQISTEGVPAANSWPITPKVTESYHEEAFGFFDWPLKYISTGVRDDRPIPSHFRASALIRFPKGKHRLLLRSRGASRLHIDGEKVLEVGFPAGDPAGHRPLAEQDTYLDLGPDFRFAPPGNNESWREFESDGRGHFVILETLVGGVAGKSKRRPELGETVFAVSPEGEQSWELVTPGRRRIPYTDAGWKAYEAERRSWLDEINSAARSKRREASSAYWNKRRDAASAWLASTKPVPVPPLPAAYPAHNEIDHFIGARIATIAGQASSSRAGDIDFHAEIQPILEARCYDCHQGGKAKGGLRLDRQVSALKGGKSDGPAIVPKSAAASALIQRITTSDPDEIMPPKGDALGANEISLLTRWINEGAPWPEFNIDRFALTPLSDDLVFLRRLTLDTVGVAPDESEISAFLAEDPKSRRRHAIDRFIADPRWADRWMGYWQDLLAENPNIINPTLNNTGPFRWWIYESLQDNKPLDLFVTELIRMEGSERFGGPAGFATASQNDVPMAAKGAIISAAFQGVEMKCARCHDAPSNVSKQEDLFQLAALLNTKPIKLPASSTVPQDRLHQTGRKALIEITLKPGAMVQPAWPFARYCDEQIATRLAENPDNPRDRLAALITAPQNERFAQVMVNRVWARLMGRGIVENLSDWEKSDPTHPELLRWLARRFVADGYDLKSITRLILNSHAYQRANDPEALEPGPLYIAPVPRRLEAEQIVDALFAATGTPFDLEEVSLDIDSVRALNNSLTLGKPRRAWMLASTSNERDRPSLSLPKIQAVASVMETFGWSGARQAPTSVRETEPNILQPAIVANGTMGSWLTRLSDRHGITQLAMESQPLEQLIDRLFLRLLTRKPSEAERNRHVGLLRNGYETRVIPESDRPRPKPVKRQPRRYVSWSNHVDGPANALALEREIEARRGDPPTEKLAADWRARLEDVLWALLNAPEWMYTP
jgi:hypothetical protein